jgi:hypothetical protein
VSRGGGLLRHEICAGSYAFETKARLAELAVLERRPDEAVALADEVLTTTEESESGATLGALLYRVRAYALAQQGDATCMAEALRWSLDVAREAPSPSSGASSSCGAPRWVSAARSSRATPTLLRADLRGAGTLLAPRW